MNTVTPPDNDRFLIELKQYQAWESQQEALFSPYIGQTYEIIERAFGKPKKITNADSSKFKNLRVEPYTVWEYGILPIGEGEKYNFFFRNGRLYEVDIVNKKQSKLKKTVSYLQL